MMKMKMCGAALKMVGAAVVAVVAVVVASVVFGGGAPQKIMVAGANSNVIALIDRETKSVEWKYSDPNRATRKCNSVVALENGDVLYAYEKGARLMRGDGSVAFDYTVGSGEELQSVSEIDGGFLFGICGRPIRIVEVDMNGAVTKEVTFDSGATNVHGQLRQIAKSKSGNYIVPISVQKRVVELDGATGALVKSVDFEHGALFLNLASDGDWLVTTGHAGHIYKIDAKSGEVGYITRQKRLNDGINIEFAAGIEELKNGNYLVANWLGHKGDQTQPILIELNKKGEVVWSMNKVDGCTFVSGISTLY